MLDERKSALWQALGLGPEWVLREELQELQHEQAQANVPAPVPAVPSAPSPTAPAALRQSSAASAHPQSPAMPSPLMRSPRLELKRLRIPLGQKSSRKLKIAIFVIFHRTEFAPCPVKELLRRILCSSVKRRVRKKTDKAFLSAVLPESFSRLFFTL